MNRGYASFFGLSRTDGNTLTHVRERRYEQNGNTAICVSHTFSMWKYPWMSVLCQL